MTIQDEEFEKWWNNNDHPYRCNPKEAFRAGRLVQREKDAEICLTAKNITNGEYFASLIREQEI